jgi:CDP-glucose 4,6-dehydratase
MRIRSAIVDLRDGDAVHDVVRQSDPEVVIHMAAQALLPRSYRMPVETWSTNVIGTITLLDALRDRPSLKAIVVVTSDKVYANDKRARPFVEDDALSGDDPYSGSKVAVEIAVKTWRASFVRARPPMVTARAGNVIGGGDWAPDRLVPDVVRAIAAQRPVPLRNPNATRPWQHVLDPVAGYLLFAERLAAGERVPEALNFGPPIADLFTARVMVERLFAAFNKPAQWQHQPQPNIPEKDTLALDASLARRTLGWRPRLSVDEAIGWTAEWYAAHSSGADVAELTDAQIARYEAL